MIELAPSVRLVGSGRLGLSMTHPLDANVYLVGSRADAVLIDAGCGLDPERIIRNVAAAGLSAGAVSRILLTHAHADHSAGAGALAAALGAQVWALPPTAEILESGDERAAGLVAARRAGLYPAEVRLQPAVVHRLFDGDEISVGGLVLTVMATPGHADGHACYLVDDATRVDLFTGDLLFARGRVAVLATHDTNLRLMAQSIQRVRRVGPRRLYPGHGEPVLAAAVEHVETAARAFELGQLPKGLLS